jgi:chromosome segregation ATPase
MSDGALRISILGDASQFKDTLADLQKRLEGFEKDLKTATGLDIPRLNFQINGIETSIKQLTEFGKFAQGSLGFYEQLKKQLEGELRVTTNRAEQEQLNKRLLDTVSIIKEIKSAGIEKPIPVPIVIEPPPPGSIADIKRQISETLKEKEVAIGVNLTNANVKLQGLRNELSVLEKQGIEIEAKPITPVLENSIQGIKNQIDELNRKKVLIDIANEGEIAQVNQQLDGLATKLARANSISFDKNGAISANAGKSRQALTSLSLVAQDLPFGFIAIQNNLPAVISSFGALRASAVGTAGVMASLGAALAGPAGLFLAFSVVTGAVTFAVQKYGSLGAAIDALTGKYVDLGGVINRAAESLKEYNENQISTNEILASAEGSQAGQILKVKTLSAVVLDLSKSENVRKKALQELQELDETRFKNFSVEKGLLDGLSDSVKEYTRAIIAQAVAQKFTDQVSTTTVELEKQRNALSDISRQLYKYGNFQERLNKLAQEQSATARQGGIPRSANKEEREIQALVNKRKELQAGFDNLTTQLDEYNLSAQNAIETASSLASGLKKTGDSADDAAKKTNKLKKAVKDLDIAELERQGRIAAFKLEEQAYKNRLKAVEDNIKAEEKLFDEIEKRFESDAADADKLTKKVAPNASIERTTEPLAELQRQFQLAYTAINQTFFEPLQNLFETFLNTGKFTFKEFTKSVLKSITSVVSKIAATGVITALMYLLDPSGMLASFGGSFGGGQGGGNGILSALGSVFGAQPRKPDFNGVRPQGGGRGGEKVEFQIRGTNLVGVLNRANGEINRIG